MQKKTIFRRALGYGSWGALLAGLLVIGGCGSGTVAYRASATTTVASPQPRMVRVRPGVWAVAEYDQPVFYSDDAYWRYENGVWYRSSYLGGWSRVNVDVVPRAVVRIDRPRRYRHYRVRDGVRVRRVPQADVRVRRAAPARRGRVQAYRPDDRSAVRDRRVRRERRMDRRQRRLERREERVERRRERRQDRRMDRRRDRRRDGRVRGRGGVVVRPR